MNVTRIRSRRNHKGARLALSALLTVSMLLGSVPNGALQAMADELEATPVEEVVPEAEDQATPSAEDQAMPPVEGEAPVDDADGEAAEPAEGEEPSADALVPLAAAAPGEGGLLGNPMPEPDPVDGLVHAWADPDTRTTVDTNAMGLTINLFNYDAVDTKPITNRYEFDHTDGSDGTNGAGTDSGINAGKNKANQLKFYETGDGKVTTAEQYAVNQNPENGINHFTGVANSGSGANFYTIQYANQGIVKAVLSGSDSDDPATRFPVLNTDAADKSTNYLFDTVGTDAKHVYSGVNNLFYLKNAGATNEMLVYDSNESYAFYDVKQGNNGDFVVYDGTYDRSGGSKSDMKVGFFPFNEFAEPGAVPCINPNEAEWENGTMDHHLGLTLNVPFVMPYNGLIHNDDNGQNAPMVFEFSGDDDMWVFVDGKLVLDIGGIHQPVSGTIDFNSGEIRLGQGTVNPPQDSNGNPVTQGGYSYSAYGIDDANNPGWQLARGDVVYLYTENGHEGILGPRDSAANRAGTAHTLQAFYLERGGCDSNLMISTNIHLMTNKKVTVSKEWATDTLDTEKNPVQVQLICKGVGRDDPSHVEYAVIDTAELNQDGSWSKTWEDLPTEGYNASGVFDETPGATNTYCDYSYMVREVPVYGFEDTYANATTSAGITMEEVTYTEGGEPQTVNAAPISDDYDPVEITNTPIRTSVAVEKAWSDGAENHAGESVYVQLQKTVDGDTSDVGDPVKLEANTDASKSWKHTFTELQLLPEGDTYNVIEGTMESGSFVAYTDDPFIIGSSVYRRVSVSYYDEEDAVMTDATSLDGAVEPYAGKVVITNEPVEAKVNIKKVDAKDQTVTLEGVTFKVYKDNGDGTYNRDSDNTFAFGSEAASTFTTGTDGTVRVDGLRPGGSWQGVYWLVETETQDAYVLRDPSHPIKVTIDNNGVATTERDAAYDTDESAPSLPAEKDNDGAQTLTVPNSPVYALPAAGGPGAYPFLLVGAFVTAFSLTGEDNKRRFMRLISAGVRR